MAWRVPDTSARSATPVTLITVRVLVPVARMTVPVGPSPSPRRTTPLARIVTLPATSYVPLVSRTAPRKPLASGARPLTASMAAWTVAPSSPVTGDTVRLTGTVRSEEHTSELQSHHDLVCRLLLEKK